MWQQIWSRHRWQMTTSISSPNFPIKKYPLIRICCSEPTKHKIVYKWLKLKQQKHRTLFFLMICLSFLYIKGIPAPKASVWIYNSCCINQKRGRKEGKGEGSLLPPGWTLPNPSFCVISLLLGPRHIEPQCKEAALREKFISIWFKLS